MKNVGRDPNRNFSDMRIRILSFIRSDSDRFFFFRDRILIQFYWRVGSGSSGGLSSDTDLFFSQGLVLVPDVAPVFFHIHSHFDSKYNRFEEEKTIIAISMIHDVIPFVGRGLSAFRSFPQK